MKNKTKETIESISEIRKYFMVIEGTCVGLLTGLLVSLFRVLLEEAEGLRGVLLSKAASGGKYVAIFIGALVIAYVVTAYCRRKVPLAGGSGIPQVKGELKGQMEQNWIGVILAKMIGGVAAIGAGLSLGREGPSIQLGAMVGKGFSRLTGRLRTEEKMLMTCGAGAGLAGAFCAPLAGVVFALEELHKNFSTDVLVLTMAASIAADFVSSYIFGLSPIFDLEVVGRLPLARYGQVIALGLLLGAFGVIYNKGTALVQDIYDKIPKLALRIAVPFGLAGVLAFVYPVVLGSGHGLVSEMAYGNVAIGAMALLLAAKFVFSLISFGSGVPGGIFLPLLVMGAISGSIFAGGTAELFGLQETYSANFVILGMTGFFAGIVRAPVTGVILITEMSGDFNNFLPLSLVALVAFLTSDILRGKPIYDQLLIRMLSKDSDYGVTEEARGHKVLIESRVHYGSLMDGQTIEKMLLPQGCLVVSVQREDKEIVPHGDTELKGGDKLVLLCSQGHVGLVEEKLHNICEVITE